MSQASNRDELLIARPVDEASTCRIESHTEVASSAAFQSIDDQFYAGKLTTTEVAVFKSRYMKLHEALKRTRDNEFNLIQLSKRYVGEIDEQLQELAKADQFPDNAITEPSQMRAQILNYYNTAMGIDERVEMLLYEAQLLKEERKLLYRDYSRLPTAELEALSDDVDIFQEMERRMKQAQNQCQDLWLEIDMLKMEAKRSREHLRQAADAEHETQSDLASLNQRLSDVKAEWVIATDLPGQYSKEAERARKYKSNAEKELQNLQDEYTQLSAKLAEADSQLHELETEALLDRERLQASKIENIDKKQLLEKTIKMHDSWYEMEMMNRTEKARYLQRIDLAEQDRKDTAEELTKIAREKDIHSRHCKKLQSQIEVLRDAVKAIQQMHDKARARYIVTPRYDGEMVTRKRRLIRAIENLQRDLEAEQKQMANEVANLSRTVGAAERRLALMEYLRAENWELIRLTTTLSEGLAKAVHEYIVTRIRHERLLEELEHKQHELDECQQVLEGLGARLADVSAQYTKMKLERNKCVSLLQAAVKTAVDTRERLRLHMNEAEIIIFRLQRHDRELAHERTLRSTATVQRDHKRNELCKMLHLHAEQMARREQMRRSIHRINGIFNQTEADTLTVKKAKERCAQMRNEQAILLIERNQEVYILQERIKAQEAACASGNCFLLSLEEEHECLQRYNTSLFRYTENLKLQTPVQKTLQEKLQGLIHELVGSRYELARLVSVAEDPDVPGRLRLLGGKDPSQQELWVTLGKLERRMAAKEEDMAEKNLTYEAVCRLVDSLQVRVAAGREDTLVLATQVNKVKDRLLHLRDFMKTMYAELVVCGAERNYLKEKVMTMEEQLDVYSLRMRYGHAPSLYMERKLMTSKQTQQMKKKVNSKDEKKIMPMRPPGTKPSRLRSEAPAKAHGPFWQRTTMELQYQPNDHKNGNVNKSNQGQITEPMLQCRGYAPRWSLQPLRLPPIRRMKASERFITPNYPTRRQVPPISRNMLHVPSS